MQTNDILIEAFTRVKKTVHSTVEGLSEQQLCFRPGSDANSIAWLVWHLARVQDDHIADLAEQEQVWTSAGWYDKFELPFRAEATGYGHSNADVAVVQASAELLIGYYDTVHDETIKFLKSLHDKDYERVVDTNWDPPVTMAVRLVSILSDDLQHAGQAAYVRGLLPE